MGQWSTFSLTASDTVVTAIEKYIALEISQRIKINGLLSKTPWTLDRINVDPFFQKRGHHEGTQYRCEACNRPLKHQFVLRSLDDQRVYKLGVSCFLSYAGISQMTVNGIQSHVNAASKYRDQIIARYNTGKRFLGDEISILSFIVSHLRNQKVDDEHRLLYEKAQLFKQIDFPMHPDDNRALRAWKREIVIEGQKQQRLLEKRRKEEQRLMTQAKPLTEQQEENLQNYVIIQCNYIANELNKNSNSNWQIESIQMSHDGSPVGTCICGRESPIVINLKNGDSPALSFDLDGIVTHNVVTPRLFARQIQESFHGLHDDLRYIKGHNGVVAFDDYSYNAAFEMGYFDDEERAQDLDKIQYLEEGGLPIPEALHASLTEFISPRVDADYRILAHAYFMLAGIVDLQDLTTYRDLGNLKDSLTTLLCQTHGLDKDDFKIKDFKSADPKQKYKLMGIARQRISLLMELTKEDLTNDQRKMMGVVMSHCKVTPLASDVVEKVSVALSQFN